MNVHYSAIIDWPLSSSEWSMNILLLFMIIFQKPCSFIQITILSFLPHCYKWWICTWSLAHINCYLFIFLNSITMAAAFPIIFFSSRLGWLCAIGVGLRCCPTEHLHPLPVWDKSDSADWHSAYNNRIYSMLLCLTTLAPDVVLWTGMWNGIQLCYQLSLYIVGWIFPLQPSAACVYYQLGSLRTSTR